MARTNCSYIRKIVKIERQNLLILDDFIIQPFNAQSRAALMEIIEDRRRKTSIIIISQFPMGKWHQVIGEKTLSDGILDRIIHQAHRIEIKVESLRKKRQINNEPLTI